MSWFVKILQAAGSLIDAAVPVMVGKRTETSAVIAAVAPVAGSVLCQFYPAACPAVAVIGQVAGGLVPMFAGASVVRNLGK
jgi:hypothetical protein